MARRGADNHATQHSAQADHSPLHGEEAEGVLSFGDGDFSDDTVIRVTDELHALLNSAVLPAKDGGLDASLGWNLFVFG